MLRVSSIRFLAVIAALIVGGLVLKGFGSGSSEAPGSSAAANGRASGHLGLRWQAGNARLYELELSSSNQTELPTSGGSAASTLAGNTRLEGELLFRPLLVGGGKSLVAVSFETLAVHELEVAGAAILADAATAQEILVGREVVLEQDERGALRQIHYRPEDPPLFQHLMHLILVESQLHVGDGKRWVSEETTLHGVSDNEYAVVARHGQHVDLHKQRLGYSRLAISALAGSDGEVTVNADYRARLLRSGALVSLTGGEQLRYRVGDRDLLAVDTEIALTFKGERRASAMAPDAFASWQRRRPGQARVSTEMARKLLEQRADGMTEELLVSELRRLVALPGHPDFSKFLWRSVGFLKLHPEAVRQLRPLFQEEGAGDRQRALVLDLLASSQHGQAQEVLVELLGQDETRSDRLFTNFVSRLSFLEAPTPATVQFTEDLFDNGEGNDHLAAAYSLGSVAGNLADRDPAKAEQLNQKLVTSLQAADSPDEQSAYLRGLGNAGLEENVPEIAPFASSDDTGVRLAVASALRDTQNAQSEAIVFGLLEDQSDGVQQASLRTLADYDLSEQHLGRVAQSVGGRRLSERSFGAVLHVLKPYSDEHQDQVASAVGKMIARGIRDPQTRARAYALQRDATR